MKKENFVNIEEVFYNHIVRKYEETLSIDNGVVISTPVNLSDVGAVLVDTFIGYTNFVPSWVKSNEKRITSMAKVILMRKQIPATTTNVQALTESLSNLAFYSLTELKERDLLVGPDKFFALCADFVKQADKKVI